MMNEDNRNYSSAATLDDNVLQEIPKCVYYGAPAQMSPQITSSVKLAIFPLSLMFLLKQLWTPSTTFMFL